MNELRDVGLGWAVTLLSAFFGVLSLIIGQVFFPWAFFAVALGGVAWLVYCFWCYQVPNIPEYLRFWKEQVTQWTP